MNGKWKQVFDKEILKRGKAYYEDGKVEIEESFVSEDLSEYTANVTGSYDYTVHVLLTHNRLRANCTCPYAREGNVCKHIAATLFQIEEEEKHSEEGNWQAILETLPTPILKALLAQVAQWDTELQKRICSYKGIDVNDPMAIHWMEIENLRLQHTYFTDYIRALRDYVQAHLQGESREVAVELVAVLYKEVFLQENYVGVLIVGANVNFCHEALERILQEASPEETAMVYEHILPLLEIPRRANNEIGLEDIVPLLPWTTDVRTRHLTWLDEHMNEDRLRTRLQLMEQLGQPPEMVLAYLKSRNEPYFENTLLEWYEEYEPATAIPLLQEACDKATSKRAQCEFSLRLLELYRKIGDKDRERDELMYLVLKQKMSQFLPQLKELLEPELWRDVFIQVVKDEQFEDDRYRLLANEKMYDILLMEIMDTEDLELFLRYETALSKQYPEQTYEILVRLLKKEMAEAGTRDAYAWVVKKLKRVKKYPNGKDRLQELVNGFYMQYSNRRAMKEELTKAGYIYNGEA